VFELHLEHCRPRLFCNQPAWEGIALEWPRVEGSTYTFEKGVKKASGGGGFADVWMRGHFAWEYKGKHKDLNAAYQQLLQYREDLENPPLLVVCDFNCFEIHTNYTNTLKQVFAFDLADLIPNQPTATCTLPPFEVLRAVFTDPGRLKPGQTTDQVTEAAAAQFSRLAESLRSRGVPSERAAHFLMRLLFCLFSEDIGLLPGKLFSRLMESNLERPAEFTKRLKQLFSAMAGEEGSFGEHDIPYFDGGLFSDDEAAKKNAAQFLSEHRKDIDWLFSTFGNLNSAELELASTIVYVDRELAERHQRGSIDAVTQRVHDIKPHFTREQVLGFVEDLLDQGVLMSTINPIAKRA
jgi:hypothetical protein